MPTPTPTPEYAFPQGNQQTGGLTKREFTAAIILAGYISHDPEPPCVQAVQDATAHADLLLAELKK